MTLRAAPGMIRSHSKGGAAVFKPFAVLSLLVLATPALADEGAPPVYQAVLDCRATPDPAARLACYDASVAAMAAARETKDLVIADRATMREAKRGLFGLPLPRLKLFSDGQSEEVTEIDGTIARSYAASDGSSIFVLADGARWKQTEGRYTYPKAGQPITIRRAALGSFFARINNQAAVRVVRLPLE